MVALTEDQSISEPIVDMVLTRGLKFGLYASKARDVFLCDIALLTHFEVPMLATKIRLRVWPMSEAPRKSVAGQRVVLRGLSHTRCACHVGPSSDVINNVEEFLLAPTGEYVGNVLNLEEDQSRAVYVAIEELTEVLI